MMKKRTPFRAPMSQRQEKRAFARVETHKEVVRESGERLRDARVGPGFVRVLEDAVRQVLTLEYPADQAMRQFFRENSGLGRRDRQSVAECVFDVLRHRRRYQHLATTLRSSVARQMVLCSLAARKIELQDRVLSETENAWYASISSGAEATALTPAVQYSLPDWLWDMMLADMGEEQSKSVASALLGSAPLDLRVNVGKTDMEAALQRLENEGISVEPVAWMPGALRVEGKPALEKNPCFSAGEVEVQDAGSQWLAALVDARRNNAVVDFCAGAGGKTLAMAAVMRSSGQIYAVDISTARLTRLRPRLVRAGVTNIQPFAIDDESDPKLKRLAGRADRVLVDAPCSGTGTLRRNPDIKWRQSEGSVRELVDKQGRILRAAARLLKPGGRLVYATCSILKAENEGVVELFLAENPQFELDTASAWVRPETAGALIAQGLNAPEPGAAQPTVLRLLPGRLDADGFCASVLRRKPLAV